MKQLPPDTVRLLSSSQVITSVLSVLKELLENSLDAGASSIDIKLENYGLDRIEVRDNGHGIKPVDAPVMARRHFTSKICCHDDLEQLETYGFRGEALGSVCAVAEVTITTKMADDDVSVQYTLNATGEIVSEKPSHLGQGTTVSALKLFKNLPVRRQFYSSNKKCKEELKKIQDLLVAYAIIKPQLRITLVHNKVVVWQKPKVADDRSALLATLGPGTVANLLPCHYHQEQPEISLEGFFPKPGADFSSTSSSTPEKTFIFVNNRPVQQKDVMKLLRQHYAAQYPGEPLHSRYPILMLKVSVPPSSVDVNLTPDKTQVLLHNKEDLLTAVEAMLLSLYGFQPHDQEPSSPSGRSETDASRHHVTDGSREMDVSHHDDGDITVFPEALHLNQQASNSSSSSSLAEDWIVNQVPHLCDDDIAHRCPQATGAASASKSLDTLEDQAVMVTETRKEQVSAADWSGGTALTDPVTREPLQPVKIHQQSKYSEERKTQHSSNTKTSKSITEKRDTLTAYDLICNKAVRAPPSAGAQVTEEEPAAALQDISVAAQESWKNRREDDHKKADERKEQQTKQGGGRDGSGARSHSLKRKAPPSNQQLLDELFASQPQKKMKSPTAAPRSWQPLPCSVAALRLQLQRLWARSAAAPRGLRLVNPLASRSAWVILCGQRLMLLNPFRVEESSLFKRLLENNILPAESLQKPIGLTNGNVGGAEYMDVLCNMEKQDPELDGQVFFSDPRLVANGFKIKLIPGPTPAERHLEVAAMAECVPFLGVDDLREILSAVGQREAKTVRECRPLKVTNYLKGEAVRLARQRSAHLSRDDVTEMVAGMEEQLGESGASCLHGRPFVQHLCDVPTSDEEVKSLLRPLQL